MQKQLNYKEFKEVQKKLKNNICIILENLEHSENIGSAFRLADAFGAEKIYILANKLLDENKINKTARNCTNYVDYQICSDLQTVLKELRQKNYKVLNLELTNKSKPLREIDFNSYGKVALLVGNERHGVSQQALESIKESVHIDMYGNNSSLNVGTALAIALYKISEDLIKNQITKIPQR